MTITAVNYATVNSVPLDTYGWRAMAGGYDALLETPALRGRDLVMPGAQGVRPYPRYVDATTVSIGLVIDGKFTENGSVNADPVKGMFQNRDYLEANLGIANDAADADRGTVAFTFVRAGLSTLTADVVVLGLRGWQTKGNGVALVRLDLVFPEWVS